MTIKNIYVTRYILFLLCMLRNEVKRSISSKIKPLFLGKSNLTNFKKIRFLYLKT